MIQKINNLTIPLIDGKQGRQHIAENFKNDFLSIEYLKKLLHYSKENLKSKDLFIETIEDNTKFVNFVQQLEKTKYNFTSILNGDWNFDKAFFFSCNGNSSGTRNSENVHHDSVGDRIKIFIGLDENINENIFNRVWLYTLPRWCNYNCDKIQRDRLNEIVTNYKYVDLKVSQTDFAIFNTNMIHQGIVGNNGQRNMIVLEISNKIKSKLVFGKVGKKI